MVNPLNAWWAQQLVLCDWAFSPEPLALDAELASARLVMLDVADRSELAWRLLECFGTGEPTPLGWLNGLELVALGGASGWLSEPRATGWARAFSERIHACYASLDDWLDALRGAWNTLGWANAEAGLPSACDALSRLEGEGEGITWSMLGDWLAIQTERAACWPEDDGFRVWRLRAAFGPVLEAPPAATDWKGVESWLKDVWQVGSRDELVALLLWLAAQGDRHGWDLMASRLLAQDNDARRRWQAELSTGERGFGNVLLSFIESGEPLDWAGWDWLRLIDLAWAGACVGWLTHDEARDFAVHGADLIISRYSGWAALARSCQRGRSLFDGRDQLGEFDADWVLLMHSPLTPWSGALSGAVDDAQLVASRQAIRRWRSDPRHWLLALAGVRDPLLATRQGKRVGCDDERANEARQYLSDVLEIHPDESIGTLARFWMPAQAHHLNQLAADAAHRALPGPNTPFGSAVEQERQVRDALGAASRHAATIHMAEEYAFHLQMAVDSALFDADELNARVLALKDTLCRFYPDVRRLLSAWEVWESLLPGEDGESSLIDVLRWHREDPGSLFHWLEWRSETPHEPGLRPSLPHFTALALAGPLNTPVWNFPQPESPRQCVDIMDWLDSHYGLHSADELEAFIDQLFDVGDRQDYQINYAPYTLSGKRLVSEIETLESGHCSEEERNHLLRLERVRNNVAGCNELDMLAWDLAQAVDLLVAARQLGWLDEAALMARLERAYRMAQDSYSGWEDYALGLFAGFSFFMGETSERDNFLEGMRQALVAWLTASPPLAGPWASLDFPGARPRHWAPMHIDTLPGDTRQLH
ncbi:YbeU/YbeR family protein [Halomonas halocynthiae]|uniref:DUF1266 domain-containing protein n=1 Tax=Halomonas halocynthiae TaxID=176290 RepID=UPI0004065288|nr:YbeU/YbeR family protein [Halomonas halocynthiae]